MVRTAKGISSIEVQPYYVVDQQPLMLKRKTNNLIIYELFVCMSS